MKSLEVTLNKDFLDVYTESTVVSDNIYVYDPTKLSTEAPTEPELAAIATNVFDTRIKCCKRFGEKIFKVVFNMMKMSTRFIKCESMYDTNNLVYYNISIPRSKYTEDLFLIFTRLGIALSKLDIVYDIYNRIYLLNNLMYPAIESLGDTQRQQVVLYLVTLCQSIINMQLEKPDINFYCTKHYLFNESNKVYITEEEFNMYYKDLIVEVNWQNTYKIYKGFDEDIRLRNTSINDPRSSSNLLVTNALSELGYSYAFLKDPKTNTIFTVLYSQIGYKIIEGFELVEDTDTSKSKPDMEHYDILVKNIDPTSTSEDGNLALVYYLGESSNPEINFHTCELIDCEYYFEGSEGIKFLLVDSDNVEVSDKLRNTLDKLNIPEKLDLDAIKNVTKLDIELSKESTLNTAKEDYASDTYAQELYKQVQSYYDTFDLGMLTNCLKGFKKENGIYSMLFIGETGTGKSTAAKVIPYKCGFPFICVNFSVNLEESDLIGSMIPNPYKKDANDAEFIWQDGLLTKAIRNGYTFIAEEINFARPGVLSKLNSLLDENRQIDLPTGECVKAHKNFRLIATCNIAYEGTNRFNKALINRFEIVHVFKEPDRDAMVKIIQERTGYKNKENILKIYTVYSAIKKYSEEEQCNVKVSLRQLLNLFNKGMYYKNACDAVKDILINGAFIEDEEHKEYFETTILAGFDLKFKI